MKRDFPERHSESSPWTEEEAAIIGLMKNRPAIAVLTVCLAARGISAIWAGAFKGALVVDEADKRGERSDQAALQYKAVGLV
jgi:hypothetical protein